MQRFLPVLDTHSDVMMDQCHINFIQALVMCSKPKSALEIGMGSGAVTKAIIEAFEWNQIPTNITCVDHFGDWHFKKPWGFNILAPYIKMVESSEEDFVKSCKDKFDLVVSDADHAHTQEWMGKSLDLVNEGGYLIYHDITNPNNPCLHEIPKRIADMGLSHFIFNQDSRPDEQCWRGMLVIRK